MDIVLTGTGSPVSELYEGPFALSGTLKLAEIELGRSTAEDTAAFDALQQFWAVLANQRIAELVAQPSDVVAKCRIDFVEMVSRCHGSEVLIQRGKGSGTSGGEHQCLGVEEPDLGGCIRDIEFAGTERAGDQSGYLNGAKALRGGGK